MYYIVHKVSDNELRQIINECYAENAIGSNHLTSKLMMKLRLLKRWNADQFVDNGQKLIFSALDDFDRSAKYRNTLDLNMWPAISFIVASAFSLVRKQHQNTILFYVLSALAHHLHTDLYDRIIALRALANECIDHKEYLIAIRILKSARKLCGKYMLPSFVNKEYRQKKKEIKQKLEIMNCFGCKQKGKALKCCTGCMKAYYCSKKCQKRHWRKSHRKKCKYIWTRQPTKNRGCDLYYMLEDCIFEPLQT